jgi:hypothetical protein
MGPRAGLDAVGKQKVSYPWQKSNTDSSIVHPVASRLSTELKQKKKIINTGIIGIIALLN